MWYKDMKFDYHARLVVGRCLCATEIWSGRRFIFAPAVQFSTTPESFITMRTFSNWREERRSEEWEERLAAEEENAAENMRGRRVWEGKALQKELAGLRIERKFPPRMDFLLSITKTGFL